MTTVAELKEKSAKLRQFFDQHLPYARTTPVLGDFVKVQHEVMWGGVWLVPGLDLKLRSFATIAAQHDMVGVCITAGGSSVLPTFGAEGRLGANPISIAAPANTQPYLLFDVATSTVAINKTVLARRVGRHRRLERNPG